MAGQSGFFDAEERLRWLSVSGDPLERLRAVVDCEAFRAELGGAALPRADRSRGGRPPYDAVPMFRVLVLQALGTLSDEQAEYQLRDAVPDAKTIWLYREQLTRAGALTGLFARFDAILAGRGFLTMGGQVVDATVVEARRPRLTKDEKARCATAARPRAGRRRAPARSTATAAGPSSVGARRNRRRARCAKPRPRSRFRCSATRTTSASIVGTASSAASP